MSTEIKQIAFDETGNDILVRIYTTTGGSATFDLTALSIDFQEHGVVVEWEPTPTTTSRTFFPYGTIQQIFQGI